MTHKYNRSVFLRLSIYCDTNNTGHLPCRRLSGAVKETLVNRTRDPRQVSETLLFASWPHPICIQMQGRGLSETWTGEGF